jgi:hypothetical protein
MGNEEFCIQFGGARNFGNPGVLLSCLSPEAPKRSVQLHSKVYKERRQLGKYSLARAAYGCARWNGTNPHNMRGTSPTDLL